MIHYKIDSGVLDEATLNKLDQFLDSVNEDVVVLDFSLMGADIKEFLPLFEEGKDAIVSRLSEVHRIFQKIRTSNTVFVANIGDFALGGGFELALACDYRVATPNSRIGLPEVKLGIFPGWGGTVCLPSLVGVETAATWITTGKVHTAEQALACGAVDAISDNHDFKIYKKFAKIAHATLTMQITEKTLARETIKSQVWPKTKFYPAPRKAVDVMFDTMGMPMQEALEFEAKAFGDIAMGSVTKNMIKMFFDNEAVKKHGKSTSVPPSRIGVVGAGLMGGGIAYQSASKGKLDVSISDITRSACDSAIEECVRLANKRGIAVDVLTRVNAGLAYDFKDSDIVIEAVTENLDIKETVLRNISSGVPMGTIIATNTSTIPLAQLEKFVDFPERFVGIHFFSPVHKMPLVEIIRGPSTSEETIDKAKAYCHKIGKTPIVVNDCTSFFVNRVLMAFMLPALEYRKTGKDVGDLDKRVKEFGWPMSPTELEQSVGEAVTAKVAKTTAEAYPHMVCTGSNPTTTFNLMMQQFRKEVRACVDEGIIGSYEEARMACILGIGFPPFEEF